MRIFLTTAAILAFVAGGTAWAQARTSDGQDSQPVPARAIPLTDAALQTPVLSAPDAARREAELRQWILDFSEWKTWVAQWGNRPEPGWFTESKERRQRPDPPEWLFNECDAMVQGTGTTADACALLVEWRANYAATQARNARAAASARQENDNKTIWWEHLHLDVGWPTMQSGINLFGVVGVHATTSVSGRLEVFVAPGAMVLNVPTRDGGRAWKLATNYGIAYRLTQFRVPGNRQAVLHVNLAKAWLLSAGPEIPTKSTDFIGFSMTFKKKR